MAGEPLVPLLAEVLVGSYTLRREEIDVTGSIGFEHYLATHTGTLTFTYYERENDE